MGCFLACFGFTKKRKRRKTSSKIIYEDQTCGKYVPLDSSDVTVKLDIVEMQNPNALATKFRDKPKESSASKIKKKVRFNLNVKSYEPLANDEYDAYLSDGEEKTVSEINQEEGSRTTTTTLEFEEEYHPNASLKVIGGSCSSYPANYRYQNCRNSYSEEEDEIEIDDSDFDPDVEDEDDDNLDSDREEDNNKLNSGSIESEKVVTAAPARLSELGKSNLDQLRDSSSTDPSVVGNGNKNQIVDSVLHPVENLTQWKAIKAKSKQQQIKQQKENIFVLQLPTHISKNSDFGSDPQYPKNLQNFDHYKAIQGGIAVDTSLSNWLS